MNANDIVQDIVIAASFLNALQGILSAYRGEWAKGAFFMALAACLL